MPYTTDKDGKPSKLEIGIRMAVGLPMVAVAAYVLFQVYFG
ncbi:MAG: hypothetical protein NXH87_17965 [Rhodobiaceae bacterium]|nr:hypothetical protein [Rhodobiaceae bacterium]